MTRKAKYPSEVVYSFPGGWTIQMLTTPEALREEGQNMSISVADSLNMERIRDGEMVVYSLRDPRNKARVTIGWFPAEPGETIMVGQWEEPIAPQFKMYVDEFLASLRREERRGGGLGAKSRHPYLNRRGKNLRNEDLRNADLTEEDLSNADLRGADLSGAILKYANLSGANLAGANLTRAYMVGADLAGANLTNANLSRAYMVNANLTDTDLTGVIFDEYTMLPDGTHWSPPAGLGYYRRRR